MVIIDDHQVLIDGLSSIIKANGMSIAGTATSVTDAQELIENTDFDIAIVDLNLGGDDGMILISAVKKMNGKVLMLSSFTDLRLIKKALLLGADGYITKESTSDYITEGLQTIAKDEKYFDPVIQKILNNSFLQSKKHFDPKERSIKAHLTNREKEVLILIAQEFTSEEIAQKLYIARSTVDTYRKNLIEKLKVKNAVGLGVWANKNGLI